MIPNLDSAIKAGESLFSVECGYTDTKHKINLSAKAVPESVLREIENGCTIETLERIAAEFPICKYQTQITIHGLFPSLANNRIGDYVNLVQNKNKSIGVRWTAIDHEKRERLFNVAHICADWQVCETSSAFFLQRAIVVTKETFQETLRRCQSELNRIQSANALFQGGGNIYKCDYFGRIFLVLRVNINSFYERDFAALASVLCDMDKETIQAKMEAHKKDIEERDAQYERECAERAAKYQQDKENALARLEEFRKSLVLPFKAEYGEHKPKQGDIIAQVVHTNRYDINSPFCVKYRTFKKQFGRLCAYECDEQGNTTKKHGKAANPIVKGYKRIG